ncbi:MAG: hypothetical protein KY460_05745 [Actinobacteria bacterium]|nr:hypothetical protein [Actinomycetota bacterium]
MPQYLLSVHMVDDAPLPSQEEIQQAYKDVDAFNAELQAHDVWVFAGGLQPPTTASVVTAHPDEVLVTDGPFVEAKEHLGGFWVITAPDRDAAVDWARRASAACRQPVEVRPFQDDETVDEVDS